MSHALNLKCPHCSVSVMDPYKLINEKQSIRLFIEVAGNKGTIRMSSIYGSYDYETTMDIPEGEIVEFACPSCQKSIYSEKVCDLCNAPLVTLKIEDGGKVRFCSRKGCKNHNISYQDLQSTLNQFYKRHQYGDRV